MTLRTRLLLALLGLVALGLLVAGVASVHQWWGQIATAPAGQVMMLRLTCTLATIMQVLTVVIALDTLRTCTRLIRGRD